MLPYVTRDEVRRMLEELGLIPGPTPSDTIRVFKFNEADVLTDDIYDSIKTGDIIQVGFMSFIVSKRDIGYGFITGSTIIGDIEHSKASVIVLEWAQTGSKELTLNPLPLNEK